MIIRRIGSGGIISLLPKIRVAAMAGALLIVLAGPSSVMAVPSGGHLTTSFNGSSFTSACVGHNFQTFGFGQNLGTDLSTRSFLNAGGGPANCNSATSSGVGTVNSSAADGGPIGNLGGSFNGTASGVAQAGVIRLEAEKTANDTQRFTGAASNGGWNDSYTVTGGSGEGLWVIPIQVTGTVNAQDPGTTAIFEIIPYINGSSVSTLPAQEAAAFDLFKSLNTPTNGDILSSSSFEISSWGVINQGGADPLTQLVVNEIVNLVVPITFGDSLDMAIYGSVLIGERAQSAADGFADAQFQNTIAWLGQGSVFEWDAVNGIGAQINDISVSAASGLDYSQSFLTATIPEPTMLALFGLGLAGLGFLRRKQV
jgi:hypothetical protein